ncbi:BrnT family toxin [Bdellovibrionota bacterium FG-1]
MRFEFDLTKSQGNKEKHGIDFVEAQVLWFGSFFEFELKTTTECRYAIVGQIDGIFWTAIITYRDERIRIISVRRSRDEEKKAYEARAKANHR